MDGQRNELDKKFNSHFILKLYQKYSSSYPKSFFEKKNK